MSMQVSEVIEYAEQNQGEWFAQVITEAWDKAAIIAFAKNIKDREEFEAFRDAMNEKYAAAQF